MEKPNRPDRRAFLKGSTAAAAAVFAGSALPAAAERAARTAGPHALPNNPRTQDALPTRNLGRTGYKVGIFSLGGQAALEQPNNADVAVPIIHRALDLGVNYCDTSSIYGGPMRWSERYYGEALKTRRNEAFLATKTKERTREGSLRMIDESLKLLQTDHVDLWQLHDIGTMTDVDQIFAKGGAIEALIEMQQQGVVRYLGITGHYRPDALMEAMRRHSFDTILMALNAADPWHFSFEDKLLPLAVENQMGIIGMKIPGRGRILSSYNPPPLDVQKHMWEGMVIATQPGTLTMKEAMGYTLSRPVSTIIIGCDNIPQLEENVRIAAEFTPFTAQQMSDIAGRAQVVSKPSLFFRFYDRA
jgi:hypothetical protein